MKGCGACKYKYKCRFWYKLHFATSRNTALVAVPSWGHVSKIKIITRSLQPRNNVYLLCAWRHERWLSLLQLKLPASMPLTTGFPYFDNFQNNRNANLSFNKKENLFIKGIIPRKLIFFDFLGVKISNFHPFIVTWWTSLRFIFLKIDPEFLELYTKKWFFCYSFCWKVVFFASKIRYHIFELRRWDWSQPIRKALT